MPVSARVWHTMHLLILSIPPLPLLSLVPLSLLLSLSLHSLPSLSPMVYNLLRAVVLEPEQGAPRIRLLASAILRELAPSSSIVVRDFNPPVEESNIPCILPILLAQTNARERLSQMAPTIIRSNISLALFPGCPQMVWEWCYLLFHVRKKLYLAFDVMMSSPVFFSSGLLSPPSFFLSFRLSLLSPFSPPLPLPPSFLLSPLLFHSSSLSSSSTHSGG